MIWEKLLNVGRLKDSSPSWGRSEFERDYDRIIFSDPFRMLKNKTQVIPMPLKDFVHTRLTHSLETACVGRSLGSLVGEILEKEHPDCRPSVLSGIVSAACLAHDIGNPPFGHSGEASISLFYRERLDDLIRNFDLPPLEENERNDLENFEGNAQGFRILTTAGEGLELTYTTLAAFTKYPRGTEQIRENGPKYGFFQAEKEFFFQIAETLGMQSRTSAGSSSESRRWNRHPLAWLVEAADDICYTILDLEDAVRLNILSSEEVVPLLRGVIQREKDFLPSSQEEKRQDIGYLRSKAVSSLVGQVSRRFLDRIDFILEGEQHRPLIRDIPSAPSLKIIRETSQKKLYTHPLVMETEAAGYEVLTGLLEYFCEAVFSENTRIPKRMAALLPAPFHLPRPKDRPYRQFLRINDYISGLTDSGAIALYRKLKGISFPQIS